MSDQRTWIPARQRWPNEPATPDCDDWEASVHLLLCTALAKITGPHYPLAISRITRIDHTHSPTI